MEAYNDCRDCAKYQGNCGNHHVDADQHIIYNTPSEAYMVDTLGSHGSCFEPTQRYIDVLASEKINSIIDKYSAKELEEALEVINHKKQTPKEPVRQTYAGHDFTTFGYCPTCGKQVSNGIGGGDKKCKSCGQVLLWR